MGDLTCKDLIEFLDDYVAGSQPDPVRTEFETHLNICPECMDYLENYKHTIDIVRKACTEGKDRKPPTEVPEKLIRAILAARKQG